MKLQNVVKKAALSLKRATPTILAVIGSGGVVATTILAVKATPKAMKLKAAEESDDKLEIVKVCWKCYIPTAIVGASTIACIIGSNVLNHHQRAGLISAYAMLTQSYREYREAAKSVYGDDADKKIIAQTAKEVMVTSDGNSLYFPELDKNSEEVLFYDEYSKRYFTSSMASVINAEYHINRNLALRGCVSVNEFYEFLGIDQIKGGDDIGWQIDELMCDGLMWLDFEHCPTKLEDSMECFIVSFMCDPEPIHD